MGVILVMNGFATASLVGPLMYVDIFGVFKDARSAAHAILTYCSERDRDFNPEDWCGTIFVEVSSGEIDKSFASPYRGTIPGTGIVFEVTDETSTADLLEIS
jgi:hypothetical protein